MNEQRASNQMPCIFRTGCNNAENCNRAGHCTSADSFAMAFAAGEVRAKEQRPSKEKVRAFRDAVARFLTSASNPGRAAAVVHDNTLGSPYHDLVMAKIEIDAMLDEPCSPAPLPTHDGGRYRKEGPTHEPADGLPDQLLDVHAICDERDRLRTELASLKAMTVSGFACANRAADPANEFAACREHCGDSRCVTAEPPLQQEVERRLTALIRWTLNHQPEGEALGRVLQDARARLDAPSEPPEATLGVGDGSGNLFVHGSYDAIKRVQSIILECEQLRSAQADLPDVESVSAAVHSAWMDSKRSKGVESRKSEAGEELMVPYLQLSEPAKELDRCTVRAVYAAIQACSTLTKGESR